MLRSIRTPIGAGDQKGQRDRHRQRPVEAGREARATELLDDVGRVGAEHHHLAVRHVDDAHHAEGDGEADRGQQQHRAQADAVDQTFWAAATSLSRAFDPARPQRRRRRARRRAPSPAATPGSPALPDRRAGARSWTASTLSASGASGWPSTIAARACARASLQRRVLLLRQRLLQRRQAVASRDRSTAWPPPGAWPGPDSSGSAPPTAASTARRIAIVDATGLMPETAASAGTTAPVAASMQTAVSGLDVRLRSPPAGSRGCRSVRASRIAGACGSPLAAQALIAASIVVEFGRPRTWPADRRPTGRDAGSAQAEKADDDGEETAHGQCDLARGGRRRSSDDRLRRCGSTGRNRRLS